MAMPAMATHGWPGWFGRPPIEGRSVRQAAEAGAVVRGSWG